VVTRPLSATFQVQLGFSSHCRLCLRSTFETRFCHVYNLFVSSPFCRTSSEVRLHISHHLPAISHYHVHILSPVVSNDHMSFTPFVWNISIALPRIFFRALTATMRCSTSNYMTLIQFSTWQLIHPTRFIPSIQSPPYNSTTISIALEISFPNRPLRQPVHLKPHILILDISQQITRLIAIHSLTYSVRVSNSRRNYVRTTIILGSHYRLLFFVRIAMLMIDESRIHAPHTHPSKNNHNRQFQSVRSINQTAQRHHQNQNIPSVSSHHALTSSPPAAAFHRVHDGISVTRV
jgi:hypothetical protein